MVLTQAEAVEPIRIRVKLHPAQLEVWESDARFKVVACGRRFGKTFLAVNMLIAKAAKNPGSICWWVAPQLNQTDVAFRFFKEAMPSAHVSINKTKKEAVLWNKSLVVFKTADNPDALRSEGLDFVALDEAAYQKSDVWPAAIRPALADKKGEAVLIGTFDGENYFYDLYVRGQNREEYKEWESWRFPSSANPFLDPAEIDEARCTTPEAEFEQEWEANPLVYVGAVFPGKDLVRSTERGLATGGVWRSDISTYAGLDWGYTNETALEVCQEDAEGRVSWIEEHTWTATELNVRCREIVEVCRQLNIEGIWADAAGADENATLALHLRNAGLRTVVQGVPFGAPVKRSRGSKKATFKDAGISTRRYYLERDLENLGPKCPKLIRDSKRYRYKEDTDEILKKDDHTVDAATAFYTSRRVRRMAMEQSA